VLGTVDFNGLVSGPGNFYGPGTANFNGGMALGTSPAEVSFEGSLAMGASNTLFVELGGTVSGIEFDVIDVLGDVTLDGSLDVSLINLFSLGPGLSFEIIDVGGLLSGTFLGLTEGGLVDNYDGNDLFITYASGDGNDVELFTAGLAGDFNVDGSVDGFDFLLWQRDTSVGSLADWQNNYGNVAPLAVATAPVPEPSTTVLLLMLSGTLLMSRQSLAR
jgi:hypothetical protein